MKTFVPIALVLLMCRPLAAQSNPPLDRYAEHAAELGEATDRLADALSNAADPAVDDGVREARENLLEVATGFRDFLAGWLLEGTADAGTETALRDDWRVLNQHVVRTLAELDRCDQAAREAEALAGSELAALVGADVRACRARQWAGRYAQLRATEAHEQALLHLIAGIGDEVPEALAARADVDPLAEAAVRARVAAGACGGANWLVELAAPYATPAATAQWRQAATSCPRIEWRRRHDAARNAFASSRLARGTADGAPHDESFAEVEAWVDVQSEGLVAGWVTVDETGASLVDALAAGLDAAVRFERCETGRQFVADFERVDVAYDLPSSGEWSVALSAFYDACRPPRDRLRSAGLGLTGAGSALLLAGVAWDLALALGPRREFRDLEATCDNTGNCDYARLEDLEERIARSRAPVGVLYGAGGAGVGAGGAVLGVRAARGGRGHGAQPAASASLRALPGGGAVRVTW